MTERLLLRFTRTDDAAAMLAYYSRPEIARYLLEEPWTAEVAQQKLSERVRRTGLDGKDGALALVVEHQGKVIGDIALWSTEEQGRIAEIGWVFNPEFGGAGYATEAVRHLLDFAFKESQLHRIVARMDARNTASARLAERLGMQREAYFRQDWWSKGEWTDTLVFGLLQSDPRQ